MSWQELAVLGSPFTLADFGGLIPLVHSGEFPIERLAIHRFPNDRLSPCFQYHRNSPRRLRQGYIALR